MFKVGDKVKYLGGESKQFIPIGAIGIVTESFENSFVAIWNKTNFDISDHWSAGNDEVELVIEEPDVMGVGLNLGPEKGGTKADSNKPDISLIPTDAIWGTAAALTYGAKKYARHNFRKGIDYSRLVAAAMRHLTAWNEGENTDAESGLSHLDHAMASLAMLKFMDVNKPECDDRFKLEKKSLTARALDTFPKNDGKNR